MSAFSRRLDAVREAADNTLEATGQVNEPLLELIGALSSIAAVLASEEYPCPICASDPYVVHQGGKVGIVTLDWDHEYVEGYAVSSWPVFASTCQDREREPYTARGMAPGYFERGVPRNHGEQLNKIAADSIGDDSKISGVLGAARERHALRRLLGFQVVRNWYEPRPPRARAVEESGEAAPAPVLGGPLPRVD